EKYPYLGDHTHNISEKWSTSTPWIFHLSRGGSIAPSASFVKACGAFEPVFLNLHKKRNQSRSGRFKTINGAPHSEKWPHDVLKLYTKTRTFIRIKALNTRLKTDVKLRSLKQLGQFVN
ncbi:hypothetical protein TCAL_15460, partial [Tigriopus californicus]